MAQDPRLVFEHYLAVLHASLPKAQPWFFTTMRAQLGVAITATALTLVPFIILLAQRKACATLSPLSIKRVAGHSGFFIIPSPPSWSLLSPFLLSAGNLISGILSRDYYHHPIGNNGSWFWVYFAWALGGTGFVFAVTGCAVTVLVTPGALKTPLTRSLINRPILVNAIALGIPLAYGIVGVTMCIVLQIRFSKSMQKARALEIILERGIATGDSTIILEAAALLPVVLRASDLMNFTVRATLVAFAVITMLATVICGPGLVRLLVLAERIQLAVRARLNQQLTQCTSISGHSDPARAKEVVSEMKRIQDRHRLVVAQWVVAVTNIVVLDVISAYTAISWKDSTTSALQATLSVAIATTFCPFCMILVSSISSYRMIFLEKTLRGSKNTNFSAGNSTSRRDSLFVGQPLADAESSDAHVRHTIELRSDVEMQESKAVRRRSFGQQALGVSSGTLPGVTDGVGDEINPRDEVDRDLQVYI